MPSLSAPMPSSSERSCTTTLRPAECVELAALLAERVDLVEEQHARRVRARPLEHLVEVLLALPEPHVEHFVEPDRVEAGVELTGDRTREERLAASGRAVEQQAAAQRLAVHLPQLRVAHRREERELDLALDVVEAADVGERHPRRFDVDGVARGVAQQRFQLGVERGVGRRSNRRGTGGDGRGMLRRVRCVRGGRTRGQGITGTRGQRFVRGGERLVPFRSRGPRRESQRVAAVRFVGQDLLTVRERPCRFVVDEQTGEVQPERGVARIGRDGGLEGGDDCGIGRQREEPRSVREAG